MHAFRLRLAAASVAAALSLGPAAHAQTAQVWGGAYVHDIRDGLSEGGVEEGPQIAAGVISAPLRSLGGPSLYLLGAANPAGGTNYAAAGLSWRLGLGERAYLRPGFGAGVHDGDTDLPSPYEPGLAHVTRLQRFDHNEASLDLGSRVLVHLELALGWQATERLAVEASWMHLSHGDLAGGQNPGLSDLGLRLVYSLDRR
jgi:hypothetical protein